MLRAFGIVFLLALGAAGKCEGSYSGQADYRLIFLHHHGPDFNPNEDLLLQASPAETARARIGGALLKSLIPIMGNISGNSTGTEHNLLTELTTVLSNVRNDLDPIFSEMRGLGSENFPIVHDTYFVPWNEVRENLFYNADKISMSASQVPNVLRGTALKEGLEKKITQNIRDLQKKSMASETALTLLGMRSFIMVQKEKLSWTSTLLLGLKPRTLDFAKVNDMVKLEKLVIPTLPDAWPVALFTFHFEMGKASEPTCHIDLGAFEDFKDGKFRIAESNRELAIPRLEGSVNKKVLGQSLLKWVGTNFAFKNFDFKISTLQIEALDVLVSPGIRFGKTNFVAGGMHIDSVDKQFEEEINKTIDGEIKKAIEKESDQYLKGAVSKDLINEAFGKIFERAS